MDLLSQKVFQINWESSDNYEHKLDHKVFGNTIQMRLISIILIKNIKIIYALSSEGKFKKVLIDDEMFNSNRSFSITKLKNNVKIIDSFISMENTFNSELHRENF